MNKIQPRAIEIDLYRDIMDVQAVWDAAVKQHINMLPVGTERMDGSFSDAMNQFFAAVSTYTSPVIERFAAQTLSKRWADVSLFNWKQWTEEVKSGTSFELPAVQPFSEPGIADKADQWIDDNVARIKGFEFERNQKLRALVQTGVRSGWSRKQLAAALEEEIPKLSGTNLSVEARADLIATDQILTANSDLTKQRMENAQVSYYTWRGMADARERPDHVALNDNVFRLDGQPMTDEDLKIVGREGQTLRTPGAEIAPGVPIRCRCYREAVWKGSDFDVEQTATYTAENRSSY